MYFVKSFSLLLNWKLLSRIDILSLLFFLLKFFFHCQFFVAFLTLGEGFPPPSDNGNSFPQISSNTSLLDSDWRIKLWCVRRERALIWSHKMVKPEVIKWLNHNWNRSGSGDCLKPPASVLVIGLPYWILKCELSFQIHCKDSLCSLNMLLTKLMLYFYSL